MKVPLRSIMFLWNSGQDSDEASNQFFCAFTDSSRSMMVRNECHGKVFELEGIMGKTRRTQISQVWFLYKSRFKRKKFNVCKAQFSQRKLAIYKRTAKGVCMDIWTRFIKSIKSALSRALPRICSDVNWFYH